VATYQEESSDQVISQKQMKGRCHDWRPTCRHGDDYGALKCSLAISDKDINVNVLHYKVHQKW